MKKAKRIMVSVVVTGIILSCTLLTAFASSYSGYTMQTSNQISGPHEYFTLDKTVMEYVFSMTGCSTSSQSARIHVVLPIAISGSILLLLFTTMTTVLTIRSLFKKNIVESLQTEMF